MLYSILNAIFNLKVFKISCKQLYIETLQLKDMVKLSENDENMIAIFTEKNLKYQIINGKKVVV